jgi:hypothetical protein
MKAFIAAYLTADLFFPVFAITVFTLGLLAVR